MTSRINGKTESRSTTIKYAIPSSFSTLSRVLLRFLYCHRSLYMHIHIVLFKSLLLIQHRDVVETSGTLFTSQVHKVHDKLSAQKQHVRLCDQLVWHLVVHRERWLIFQCVTVKIILQTKRIVENA